MNENTFTVQVFFFATFKDLVGMRYVKLTLPVGAKVSMLKNKIQDEFPILKDNLKTAVIAVNHEFASDADDIPVNAEIAIFPPVSGGNDLFPTIFAITDQEIDMNDLVNRITLPSTGAACIFSGMVRGFTQRDRHFETSYLVYEAYPPMAERKMRQVADEIRSRWPAIEGIAIVQRVGKLNPGTPTVLIACTAAHRDTGVFEAARYGIDRLKEIVPVWKKEVGPEGQEWVEGGYAPTKEDN
jgi:MoaE-MoaD fusion protein